MKGKSLEPAELTREDFERSLHKHARAYPALEAAGVIRKELADFKVKEELSFKPSGAGEHLFLRVEKQGCNTDWVARDLQKRYALRSQDIGYAGKKDRHSVSQQWFSLHLPGRDVDLGDFDGESYRLIESSRHNKKLRVGSVLRNDFKLIIRDLSLPIDRERIEQIGIVGVPNYFGYQRFGHNGSNLVKADDLFAGQFKVRSRNQRGLFISAARSYLFNRILSARIEANCWNSPIAGDCMSLDGKGSYFRTVDNDESIESIESRMHRGDIHVSGWMPGNQVSEASKEALEFELNAVSGFERWLTGLAKAKVDSSRRSFRVIPEGIHYEALDARSGEIRFSLPGGSYATVILRELLNLRDAKKEGNKND